MAEYLCILGREPELSVAELEAVFGADHVEALGAEVAVVRPRVAIEPAMMARFGGTQKIAVVADQLPQTDGVVAALTAWLTADRLAQLLPPDGRDVGLSLYQGSNAEQERLRRHLLQLKKELRQAGRAIRVVTSKERHLSAVTIQRQGLLQHGREIVVTVGSAEIFIGTTMAIQDYQAYGLRDFGRPAADPKRGMVPPKLAQIMLNLAGLKSTDILLDPFCGVGTVLQEAAMLGAGKIFGSDTDQKAVKAAQENIRWLVKEYPHLKADIEITLRDARHTNARPTVVVTEPDLGRPTVVHQTLKAVEQEATRLEKLYHEVFSQWAQILEPGTRVVMIWPLFVGDENTIALNLESAVTKLGFELQPLLSQSAATALKIPSRTVLEYGRDQAKVRRQIRCWVKR